MSKPTTTITHCEYCDKIIEIQSPPTKQQYQEGLIHIEQGSTVLLHPEIVEQNLAEGLSSGHSTDLEGYYCNYFCLINKLKQILKLK